MNKTVIVMLVLVLGVLAVLFVLMKPGPEPQIAPSGQSAVEEQQAGDTRPQTVEIMITGGKLSRGPEVLRITQGDEITLVFTSDKDAELHLHGYDLRLQLRAGESAELTLRAEHSGRFEYELHGHHAGSHQALGVIEVQPQ